MKKKKSSGPIILIILLAAALLYASNKTDIDLGGRAAYVERTNDLILRLNFDDPINPWQDTSQSNILFTPKNGATWVNESVCRWYGCLDATDDTSLSGDAMYLEGHKNIDFTNGFATSFWIYLTTPPSSGGSSGAIQGYFDFGFTPPNGAPGYVRIMETGWGPGINWIVYQNGTGGGASMGSSKATSTNQWTHIFIDFVASTKTIKLYKNGVLISSSTQSSFEPIPVMPIDLIRIATHRYGDMVGYIDEINVWNGGGFSQDDVTYYYESRRKGTPPNLDVYVKDIKYELPYDWNAPGHPIIMGGSMPISITIANEGITDSGNFGYTIELEGITKCSGTVNIPAGGNETVTCNWQTSEGFHKGWVNLNIQDNVMVNNKQRVYIPFMDRPWFSFTPNEWDDTVSMCSAATSTSDPMAYTSCNWERTHKNPCSSTFIYTSGNDVDPRGTCARSYASYCRYNNYNDVTCAGAMSFLNGWANLPISTYTNPQAIHQLLHVGIAMDIMQPYMTKAEWDDLSIKYEKLSQAMSNHPNVLIEKTTENAMKGDNGWGFGSGLSGFAVTLLGASKDNPTMIHRSEQTYWGDNVIDLWGRRELSYLRSYKDDPNSQYQEGWGYKQYAEPHLQEIFKFKIQNNFMDSSEYQNALCAMGRETLSQLLDYSYDGFTLRGDKTNNFRAIPRGDSNSYSGIDSSLWIGWDYILYEAINCNDPNIKGGLMWLRQKLYETGEITHTSPFVFLWPQLKKQVQPKDPNTFMPKFIYDNANDIAMWRTGYTYINDDVFQVDGGEEKGGGHSQAQGYILYALGEPFLDYEQVPFNDDVRDETWKNGISLTNTQGINGWNSQCGDVTYNAYYGMQNCPAPVYPDNYPENRVFPLSYGGDLENYIGSDDARFGGVYVWRPYKGLAEPVKQYFIKFGDIVVERAIVKGSPTGQVYHNFINVNNEFLLDSLGTKFTLTRTGTIKHMDTDVVYSSSPLTLAGGDSGVKICFCKTSCSGSCGGTSNYRRMYYSASSPDLDMILYHHWYTSSPTDIQEIGTIDKGLRFGQSYIIFDTNNDGTTEFNGYTSDGWGIAYNEATEEYAAMGATYIKKGISNILTATDKISMYSKAGEIQKNTWTRDTYTDSEKTVYVSSGGTPPGPICTPSTEVCDNDDNDCDGETDESLQRTCFINLNPGIQTCSAGTWNACTVSQINTYSCINNVCVTDINGAYSATTSCQAACSTTTQNNTTTSTTTTTEDQIKSAPVYHTCTKNGACIVDTQGKYLTNNCNNECYSEPKSTSNLFIIVVVGIITLVFFINKKGKKR